MKIVFLDTHTVSKGDVKFDAIAELGDVSFFDYTKNEDVAARIGDSDAVICNKSPITRDVFEKCPNLKYIGLTATGYNNVDLEAATMHGAVVSNVPEYSTNAVAQHVFALILHYFNRVSEYSKGVAEGDWINSTMFSYFHLPIYEISDLKIGIIGFGSIGKKVCEIASAFGMKVLVYTRTKPIKNNDNNVEFVSLDELLSNSDVVTIHCPLNEQTQNLICEKNLVKMKNTALLINAARGPIVNEDDLAFSLNNDIIAAAGLDVVAVEPMLESNPLRTAKNCFITPHIAWAPKQTRERLINIVAQNLKAFIKNSPQNIVNKGSV